MEKFWIWFIVFVLGFSSIIACIVFVSAILMFIGIVFTVVGFGMMTKRGPSGVTR